MNFRNKIWKYATAMVVVLLLLNPEVAGLAMFIDAIGLEMFLMLLEVQLLAIMGVFIIGTVKPAYAHVKSFSIHSLGRMEIEFKSVALVVPFPVILMNVLVVSFLFATALGVH